MDGGRASMADVVTFGCRLNTYESEVMRGHADAAGLSDTVIINTCAVTARAERQARSAIRKLRRERPKARIIVTGCSAQIKPEFYAAMPEVDHVLGNDAKLKSESWQALDARVMVNDIQSVTETAHHMVDGFEGIARAFVQVQNGCDHRCTFCIIPYGRGVSRSVPVGVIAEHVRHLAARGYKEIVFTGVDIASYGRDLPGSPTLGQMVRRVLALAPDVPRLRLSSLDPACMDTDIWHLLAHEPRLMPHLHLSVQAGDDMVLKRMKRRHTRQDIVDLCARARALRSDCVFGADIIAGFPTEDDAMFQNTLRLVGDAGLTWLHVFPYSPRAGTPAARMPQVDTGLRTHRAAQLREVGRDAVAKLLSAMVGTVQDVLVENNMGGTAIGRTPNYAEVRFASDLPAGALTRLPIEKSDGERLYGKVA